MTQELIFLLLISFLVNILIIYFCREITFSSKSMAMDNERILFHAKNFKFNTWPSIVRDEGSRIQNKEFWFLALSILCKFFKNPQKEIVNVVLSLLSNTANTLLIYFITLNIFDEKIALICSLFYLTSFWPYQVSIYFGHIVYSTMWFLISILFITLIEIQSNYSILSMAFLSGLTTFISFSSSSSSRKYPPLILLFLIVSLSGFIEFQKQTYLEYLPFIIVLFLSIFILNYTSKILSTNIINFFIKKNYTQKNSKNEHLLKMKKYLFYFKLLVINFLSFSIFFTSSKIFLLSITMFFIGFSLISLYLLLPNIPKSLITYASFLNIGQWASHFLIYPKNFFSKEEKKKFKNKSFVWLPKFFFRISPVIFILFFLSISYIFLNFRNNYGFHSISILFIFLPIFISEISGSLKVGKSYFPSFMGFILSIACASDLLIKNYSFIQNNLINVSFVLIILNLVVNSYFFFKDILPSRLFQVKLKKYLESKNIHKFSTYNTAYNNSTIIPMLDSFKNFEVDYVNSLKDSKNNVFIIPPISSKGILMETEQESIKNGDFKSDEILNKLIKKNLIKNYIDKEFVTMNSSKIWVLESEVTGFRDLNLNDISDYDRWLGMCRIIDLKELKKINFAI